MVADPSHAAEEHPDGEPIAESDIDAFSELLGDDRALWEAFEAADSHP